MNELPDKMTAELSGPLQERAEKAGEGDTQAPDSRRLLQELQALQDELGTTKDELARSEERARLAIEASNSAVWEYDPVTDQLLLSETCASFLGREKKAVSTTLRKLLGLVHEDDRHKVETVFVAAAAEGDDSFVLKASYRVRRVDGSFAWLISEGRVMERDRAGRALHMTGITRDITEFKVAEKALISSELQFRALFENSRDALLTNVPPDWHFTSANRAARNMFGVNSEAEFLSLTPMDISPEFQPDGRPSAEKARQVVEKALRDGSSLFEWVHRRMDGTTFPVEVMLTRMESAGQIFVLGSLRDISERRSMERKLQDSRKEMEDLHKRQVAMQVAAAFAHELNQPLQALSNYVDTSILRLDAGGLDMPGIRQMLEKSREQVARAGENIRQMIESLQVGDMPPEPFDLNSEITAALALVRAEQELQFHAELRLAEGLLLVLSRRTHVRKALLNIFHNSLEAMQQAGVSLPRIRVAVHIKQDQGVAMVTIQDNGPGVRQEDIKRLFQPFFSTKEQGIGVGLAISRSLIEANDGQLWFDPGEGPGAVFHFTLPLAERD